MSHFSLNIQLPSVESLPIDIDVEASPIASPRPPIDFNLEVVRVTPTPDPSAPAYVSTTHYILTTALDNYTKQTGMDLMNYSFVSEIEKSLDSPDAILSLFLTKAKALRHKYRTKDSTLINGLRPLVHAIHELFETIGLPSVVGPSKFVIPLPAYPDACLLGVPSRKGPLFCCRFSSRCKSSPLPSLTCS